MPVFTRFIILLAFVFVSSFVFAEQKIAFVNQAKLLQKAPQAEYARTKLQKEFASRDKALVSLQKKIKKAADKLQKNAAVLSVEELNKLKRKVTLLSRDLERDKAAFKEDLSIRQNEELIKLQKSVLKSIQTVAEKEKYDLILSEGIVYASQRSDITDKILAQLKKQYKSGQ
ncbi:MAG: OmpH family outer membrane protein [gamma proteobacterium symbiont of Taylorina sp.]|nr:OmpH family outer membrane protein [gamma proteobacterium symbiont of Taylorina sp.]